MSLSSPVLTVKYSRLKRYTARILATLLMLGLALTCWYDAMLGNWVRHYEYSDWVAAAGTITFVAIITGWCTLRSSAIFRATIFLIWLIATLFLTIYAITLSDVLFESMAQFNELLSVWLTKYMLFFIPGLLFVAATASFAWMLICGQPAKTKNMEEDNLFNPSDIKHDPISFSTYF